MKMENIKKLKRKGFIAALDQSLKSTPAVLRNYGIEEFSDKEMPMLIKKMRERIITNKYFDKRIMATIIFEDMLEYEIDNKNVVDYLKDKGILTFLKIDEGLQDKDNGISLMNDIIDLDIKLKHAKKLGIVGTKMRSVIYDYNEASIRKIIKQQFAVASKVASFGLIPIIEPEVDIKSLEKAKIEKFLASELNKELADVDFKLILKVTLPDVKNTYLDLTKHESLIRLTALSGGYTAITSNFKLASNKNMIASFSRALLEGLNVNMNDKQFSEKLDSNINNIYEASINN